MMKLSVGCLTLLLIASMGWLSGCDPSAITSSDATVTTEPGVEVSTKTPPAPPATPAKSEQ